MANKKETTAKKTTTTKKAPAKRLTAAQKLKVSESKVKELEETLANTGTEILKLSGELENSANTLYNERRAVVRLTVKLGEEQAIRDQFFHDVEVLVKKYEESNWFNRIFNAIRLVGSFIKVINYYKEATNEKG